MPRTVKRANSSRKRTARGGSSKRPKAQRTRSHVKKSTATRRATRKTRTHKTTRGTTYVFECTREGCGYRIVREEKAEVGEMRFDLKCPKCHNSEFKCLGKGDLPEALELAIPTTPIDFDSIRPLDLGSN